MWLSLVVAGLDSMSEGNTGKMGNNIFILLQMSTFSYKLNNLVCTEVI